MRQQQLRFLLLLGVLGLSAACAAPSAQITPTSVPPATTAPTAAAAAEPTGTSPAAEPTAATLTKPATRFVIDSGASTASYAVDEVFLAENRPFRAIGTANSVSGNLEVVTDGVPAGSVSNIRVDLRTLTSDSPRRDQAIRTRWLESDTYPYAEFTSTEALNLPAQYTPGSTVTFTLKGNLTVRGITIPTTWEVTGVLADGVITADATTAVTMSSFGFDPPNIAGMIRAEDGVTLTVHIVARAE